MLKSLFRSILGPINMGKIDYIRHPDRINTWGGAFNGQSFRTAMFREIIEACRSQAIVETGTFRGATTELFATTGLPVYSTEQHARTYGFAHMRLRKKENVKLFLTDSRSFLRKLQQEQEVANQSVFYYLDAHWNDDLPLEEELEIILSGNSQAVIMIDDFQVDDDAGYMFDDYGPGKALTLEYLQPAIRLFHPQMYFPAKDSDQESGLKRGSIVLCCDEGLNSKLQQCHTLRTTNHLITKAMSDAKTS